MRNVTLGVTKIQEATSSMSHMISQLSDEMREAMQKVLHSLWEKQQLLARQEQRLPKQIDLPIIRFRDAFNEVRAFPFDLCREWQTFQGLVILIFTERQGLHRVKEGQYFVTNFRIGQKLDPLFWSNAIEPGDELSMTMVLDDVESQDGVCPFDSCREPTKDVPSSGGGKVYPKCFRFAAMSRKESFEQISMSNDPTASAAISESRSDGHPDMQNLGAGSAGATSQSGKRFRRENIELYHSIQVVQALLGSVYNCTNHGCRKSFSCRNDLERHEATHHFKTEVWRYERDESYGTIAEYSEIFYEQEECLRHLFFHPRPGVVRIH